MLNTIHSITSGFYNISTCNHNNNNKQKNTHRKSISPLWNVYSCMPMCSPRCCGEKFHMREKLDGGGWGWSQDEQRSVGRALLPVDRLLVLTRSSSWARAAPVKSRNICCPSCSFRACLQLLSLRLFRVFVFFFYLVWPDCLIFFFLCGLWGRHSTWFYVCNWKKKLMKTGPE